MEGLQLIIRIGLHVLTVGLTPNVRPTTWQAPIVKRYLTRPRLSADRGVVVVYITTLRHD